MVRRFLCFIKDVLLYADFQVIRPLFFPAGEGELQMAAFCRPRLLNRF